MDLWKTGANLFFFFVKFSIKKYYLSIKTASLWGSCYSVSHSSETKQKLLTWYLKMENRHFSIQREPKNICICGNLCYYNVFAAVPVGKNTVWIELQWRQLHVKNPLCWVLIKRKEKNNLEIIKTVIIINKDTLLKPRFLFTSLMSRNRPIQYYYLKQ